MLLTVKWSRMILCGPKLPLNLTRTVIAMLSPRSLYNFFSRKKAKPPPEKAWGCVEQQSSKRVSDIWRVSTFMASIVCFTSHVCTQKYVGLFVVCLFFLHDLYCPNMSLVYYCNGALPFVFKVTVFLGGTVQLMTYLKREQVPRLHAQYIELVKRV